METNFDDTGIICLTVLSTAFRGQFLRIGSFDELKQLAGNKTIDAADISLYPTIGLPVQSRSVPVLRRVVVFDRTAREKTEANMEPNCDDTGKAFIPSRKHTYIILTPSNPTFI